jgi:hypothetical protein
MHTAIYRYRRLIGIVEWSGQSWQAPVRDSVMARGDLITAPVTREMAAQAVVGEAYDAPPFVRGQPVVMGAFTDSDGRQHAETPPLRVAQVRFIPCQAMDAYYRVLAYGPGLSSYEGHSRFFRAI